MRKSRICKFSYFNICILIFFAPFLYGGSVKATSESSNFRVYNAQVNPVVGDGSSANFQADTGGDSIAGKPQSGSFRSETGSALQEPFVPTNNTSVGEVSVSLPPGGSVISTNIHSIIVTNIAIDGAMVRVETDPTSLITVTYGTAQGNLEFVIPEGPSYLSAHQIFLPNLQSNTEYFVRVRARSLGGSAVESAVISFVTLPIIDTIPAISNLSTSEDTTQVRLQWQLPEAGLGSRVRVLRSIAGPANSITDGEILFDASPVSTFVDTTVIPGQQYYYTVFLYTPEGRKSSGVFLGIRVPSSDTELAPDADEEYSQTIPPLREDVVQTPKRQTFPISGPRTIAERLKFPFSKSREPIVFIPAKPNPLPETVKEVKKEEKVEERIKDQRFIRLFNNVEQGVSIQYNQLLKSIDSVNTDAKNKLSQIRDGLVDALGKIDMSILTSLSNEEQVVAEEILEVSIPNAYDPKSVFSLRTISAETGASANWNVVAGTNALLSIPSSIFQKEVLSLVATFQTSGYVLTYNPADDSYNALLKMPEQKNLYELRIQVIYKDNTFEEISKSILVDPAGVVTARNYRPWSVTRPWDWLIADETVITGVSVYLEVQNSFGEWVRWPAEFYNQDNPIVTNALGEFAFFAPPGTYRLNATYPGHNTFQSDHIVVEDRLVKTDISLRPSNNILQIGLVRYVVSAILLLSILLLSTAVFLRIK